MVKTEFVESWMSSVDLNLVLISQIRVVDRDGVNKLVSLRVKDVFLSPFPRPRESGSLRFMC